MVASRTFLLVSLCLAPWLIGGEGLEARVAGLILGGLAVAAEILRGPSVEETVPNPSLRPLTRILLGALFAQVCLQVMNEGWRFDPRIREGFPPCVPVPGFLSTWFPSGVSGVPWAWIPPVLVVASWVATLLLAWTFWRAVRTRERIVSVLVVVAVNGTLVAALGIFQRLTGVDRILGFFDSPNDSFFATFVYRGHAAAYLNLCFFLHLALALHFFRRTAARGETSGPAGLFLLGAGIVSVGLLATYSRTAIVLHLVAFGGVLLASGLRFRRGPSLVALAVVLGLVVVAGKPLGLDAGLRRFRVLIEQGAGSEDVRFRLETARTTVEIIRAAPVFGHGPGSFHVLFPGFRQPGREALLLQGDPGRHPWVHAHNDYLEVLAELGVVGASLVALLLVQAGRALSAAGFWRSQVSLMLVLGFSTFLLHALVDYPARNPAVLTTAVVVLLAAVRWAQLGPGRMEPAESAGRGSGTTAPLPS